MTDYQVRTSNRLVDTGLLTLVGKDEALTQNKFCNDVEFNLNATKMCGCIKHIVLYSTEIGSGSTVEPAGTLYILKAEPTITANSTDDLTASDWLNVLDFHSVVAADWHALSTGGSVYVLDGLDIPVEASDQYGRLWLAFFMSSNTPFNDAAGDDEILRARILIEEI